MATQYIGSRYVPMFADPAEWTNTRTYEALTIVLHNGNSFTSRQPVPIGIDIANEDFWVETGNYNAQVEQYRQEVMGFDARITAAEQDADAAQSAVAQEETARVAADQQLSASVTQEETARVAADQQLTTDIGTLSQSVTDGFSTVNDDIDALREEIRTQDKLTFKMYEGHRLVTFGDSYMDPNAANSYFGYLPTRLAGALDMELSNFAVAGAGWGRSSRLISEQTQNAESTLTADEKNDVRLVIGYAGVNDILNEISYATSAQGVLNFITDCRTMFPNAEIYVIPCNWGFSKLTVTVLYWIHSLMRTIRTMSTSGVTIVDRAWEWLLGWPTWYHDQVHPSQAGYNQICGQILNAIAGGNTLDTGRCEEINLGTAVGSISDGFMWFEGDGITMHVHGWARKSTDGAATINILNQYVRPQYAPAEMLITPIMNSDMSTTHQVGYVNFQPDGQFVLRIPSDYMATNTVWWDASYIAGIGNINWSDVN